MDERDALAQALSGSDEPSYGVVAYADVLIDRLKELGFAIYKKRVQNGRRNPTANKLTPQLIAKIRREWNSNQDITQRELSAKYGVNAGRISEIINGKL